jgi:aminoglycoside phosphotransferase (APT) family kinase protein
VRGSLLDSAIQYIEANAAFLKTSAPKIIHGDFHFGNVLHEKGTVTGILDFEWARGGDPEYDWRLIDTRLALPSGDGTHESFCIEYSKLAGLRSSSKEQSGVYDMHAALELADHVFGEEISGRLDRYGLRDV